MLQYNLVHFNRTTNIKDAPNRKKTELFGQSNRQKNRRWSLAQSLRTLCREKNQTPWMALTFFPPHPLQTRAESWPFSEPRALFSELAQEWHLTRIKIHLRSRCHSVGRGVTMTTGPSFHHHHHCQGSIWISKQKRPTGLTTSPLLVGRQQNGPDCSRCKWGRRHNKYPRRRENRMKKSAVRRLEQDVPPVAV